MWESEVRSCGTERAQAKGNLASPPLPTRAGFPLGASMSGGRVKKKQAGREAAAAGAQQAEGEGGAEGAVQHSSRSSSAGATAFLYAFTKVGGAGGVGGLGGSDLQGRRRGGKQAPARALHTTTVVVAA